MIASGTRLGTTRAMAFSGTGLPVDDWSWSRPIPSMPFSSPGSASRMTRYWFDWVKIVEMIRCPKAL